MTRLPNDPLDASSLADYGARLRRGETTIEATVRTYLARIALLDPRIGAFEHVAQDSALATARALDALLAAGTDLGPLMGVPVGVKDIFAVDGMPATGGSNLDLAAFIGAEGSFVKRLRAAGCVILGKTKTVEFAFGAVGLNASRGTPWNPCDAKVHRIPGGSSNGSAAAVGAGLCAFAIGSDTGGSVRVPASLCGTVGLKTSDGRWARDGVLPLSPTLDTIGLLARSADDAALAFAVLDAGGSAPDVDPRTLRLARPTNHFFDDLDPEVEQRIEEALEKLRAAGATIVDIEVPEVGERETIFPNVLAPELVAGFGRERFEAERGAIDPLVAARMARGTMVTADAYIRSIARRQALVAIAAERMRGFDGWVTPATTILPAPVADFEDSQKAMHLTMIITRNSQPGNMFAQCGLSIPVPGDVGRLPVGLQIMAANGDDARLLSVGRAVEHVIGRPPAHDMTGFSTSTAERLPGF